MATLDVFSPLDRVVAKYRRDVHHLSNAAPPEALSALEGHLGRPLPPDLREFLARHNGASLFRGALRIRSAAEMALASEASPQVVLFADGQGDSAWGWAKYGHGGHAFGPWDGARLTAAHASFTGWLAARIAVLDTRVTQAEHRESIQLEADPDDPWQLWTLGEKALRTGRPEEAESALRK